MNKKDNKKTYNKYKLIQLYVILGVLLFSYGIFITYRYLKISGNSNTVLNNVYLSQFDLSNATYDQVKEQLSLYNDNILDQVVILKYNDKEIGTTFKNLGLSVDTDAIIKEIKDYQDNLSYSEKVKLINGNKTHIFNMKYTFNKEQCINTLNNIKATNDVAPVDGHFDVSEGVKFIKGTKYFCSEMDKPVLIIAILIGKYSS